ncbi:SGNH/GDSL hydrolase family protein [Eilatimonas milleporae]|uniref:GDSL-like lipase/acylhydrolase family protein n=1 Tax=Eilatimonas milleporae TaxID=911205 RepID=A0A3M0CRZ2_9PROT|nr:2OG-Fe(II) oxygenase family protein [Eilatimonas milleporae]RMB12351.1 hypothetical protein BXY39_0847 [Eilatimonas milleporae]
MGNRVLKNTARHLLLFLAAVAGLELLLNARSGFSNTLPNFFQPGAGGTAYVLKHGRHRYLHRGRPVNVSINGQGHRYSPGGDRNENSAPQRVVLIGDSQVFGWGLDDAETLSNRLQAHIGPDYRVINKGLPGTGPWSYWESAAEETPDTILVTVYTEINDGQDSYTRDTFARVNCSTLVVPGGPAETLPCWMMETALFSFIVDARNMLSPYHLAPPINCNPLTRSAAAVIQTRIETLDQRLDIFPKRIRLAIPWDARIDSRRLANYRPVLAQAQCFWAFPGDIDLVSHMTSAENRLDLFQRDDQHLSAEGVDLVAALLARHILARHPATTGEEQNQKAQAPIK